MSDSIAPEGQGETLLRLLMLAAVFAIPVVIVLQPVIDWDLWWHLRAGDWVLHQRTVPTTDPFSQQGAEKPWLAYSWLFEVLLALCFRSLGLTGVMLFTLALSLLNASLLYHFMARRIASFLTATSLTALALLALGMLFRPRPWQFSILFSLLTLDAVSTLREGKTSRAIWWLPIAYVLWANLHIQWIYGLALLFLAVLAPQIDARLGWDGAARCKLFSPSWNQMLGLTVLCSLATLLNPYGIKLYGVIWDYATQPGPYQFIPELMAPLFRQPNDWALLLLAALAVFVLGRSRGWGTFELLLLGGSAVLSFRSRRDLWLLVLSSAAILASVRPIGEELTVSDRFRLTWWRGLILAGVVVGIALGVGWTRGLTEAQHWEVVQATFPLKAAQLVRERGYSGPLFNDFDWGGFLIWSLPELPVAVDGRTNLHGDARLLRFNRVWAGLPGGKEKNETGWSDDPDLLASGVVIAPAQIPLAELLACDQRFEEVPTDDPVARVFIARRP